MKQQCALDHHVMNGLWIQGKRKYDVLTELECWKLPRSVINYPEVLWTYQELWSKTCWVLSRNCLRIRKIWCSSLTGLRWRLPFQWASSLIGAYTHHAYIINLVKVSSHRMNNRGFVYKRKALPLYGKTKSKIYVYLFIRFFLKEEIIIIGKNLLCWLSEYEHFLY